MDFGRVPDVSGVDFSLPRPDPRGLPSGAGGLRVWVGAPVIGAKAWEGKLYPKGTRSGEHLALYAKVFDALELNSSFYAVPSVDQVRRWADAVPPDFRFCPKVPRTISHGDPAEIRAFAEAAAAFGDRLGTCLLQLPPSVGPDEHERLWAHLDRLPRGLPFALELRHPGWFWRGVLIGRVYEALRQRGWSAVITDTPGRRDVCHATLTAPEVLIRLVTHDGHPSDATRAAAWAERLALWGEGGLERAWVTVHQPYEGGILECARMVRDRMRRWSGSDRHGAESASSGFPPGAPRLAPPDASPRGGPVPHTEIIQDEQQLLDRVQRLLAEHPLDVPPSEQDTVTELVRLRDEMAQAKEEDKGALLQQYEHHYAVLSQMRSTRDRPQVDPSSPYFAHLRLEERGRQRDLCLGKATRIDGGLRIVDWRNAPISRIFYSYQQGDEFEEEVAERTMAGRIVARRTVTIQHGQLHRVDAPEGMFLRQTDGSWASRTLDRPRLLGGQQASVVQMHTRGGVGGAADRRLGTDSRGGVHRADKRLPDIAGLIDPAQFDLITRPREGFLVIRGTAGSGKTTVALHRIAWLAYEDARIDSRDTLFLVFSKALRDYVGRVLPALGLNRVDPQTFPDWAREARRRHFPKLPKKYRDDTPEIVVRLKMHPATMVALERHIEASQEDGVPGTLEQALDDWASVLTQLDVLEPVIERLASEAFSPEELRKAVSWCRDRHEELLAWMEGEPESEGLLDVEDDALLLRAWQLRVGPLRRADGAGQIRYKHVCIDEVQDFSPVEVRVLIDCLDEKKSITLSGDTQQHVMQHAGFTSWTTFFEWLGVKGTAVETLRVAYRSSRPIVELATRLLGDLREDDTPPMTVREGPPVEVFRFTDHGAVVAFLADILRKLATDEPLANVALITPTATLSERYEAGLRAADVPRLRRVIDETFSFLPGVEIVEAQSVKGLEFDYVIIVEASAMRYPDTPSARRLLHVAATRAIHQLWVTSTGSLSPPLEQALAAPEAT